jgi:hypothetical protein
MRVARGLGQRLGVPLYRRQNRPPFYFSAWAYLTWWLDTGETTAANCVIKLATRLPFMNLERT